MLFRFGVVLPLKGGYTGSSRVLPSQRRQPFQKYPHLLRYIQNNKKTSIAPSGSSRFGWSAGFNLDTQPRIVPGGGTIFQRYLMSDIAWSKLSLAAARSPLVASKSVLIASTVGLYSSNSCFKAVGQRVLLGHLCLVRASHVLLLVTEPATSSTRVFTTSTSADTLPEISTASSTSDLRVVMSTVFLVMSSALALMSASKNQMKAVVGHSNW